MAMPYRYLRLRLSEAGLLPTSKLALITWYLLGFDLALFGMQQAFAFFKPAYGKGLGGWVSFLSFVVVILFLVLALRWLKAKLLWRLRNRLIVTYVFFGLIPVVLLVALTVGSFYLFAGQFAAFVVTTGLNSELQTLDAANSALAHGIAVRMEHGNSPEVALIDGLRRSEKSWAVRHVHIWLDGKIVLNSAPAGVDSTPPVWPSYLQESFNGVMRDRTKLYLRAAKTIPVNGGKLTVISSEPLDQRLLQGLASDLGEITLYEGLVPTYSAGTVPPSENGVDLQVTFPTSVKVINWTTGDASNPATFTVRTRVSQLRQRLFEATGDFASTVEFVLLGVAIFFAVIEIVALWIGTRLTRTVTGAVAQLYEATTHINRGDFSHRIPVRSTDQLSALANSFNSMTTSLEKLIEEQKDKQRLENELMIAQEVQEQLYPRQISQLASLEVHGFCRPARTVSGDYYDFLKVDSEKLLLAVGDISGKGISAALLMATIHSAVRAYSLEGIPILQEAIAVGAGLGSGTMLGARRQGAEVSPGNLLALLNHQLYQSTPMEKYATLFLGVYDGEQRKLIYSNGGHLPPIVLGEDGSLRRLGQGGTVIGLFDNCSYEESSVQLRRGEIFLAYSDGVTEPENDFGEFGEQRLIELVQQNRDLPLARISEIVTNAVDDWIGANEQPDDVTLVLARAR
jgi:phosphoserine phosphatase RsbU/P